MANLLFLFKITLLARSAMAEKNYKPMISKSLIKTKMDCRDKWTELYGSIAKARFGRDKNDEKFRLFGLLTFGFW